MGRGQNQTGGESLEARRRGLHSWEDVESGLEETEIEVLEKDFDLGDPAKAAIAHHAEVLSDEVGMAIDGVEEGESFEEQFLLAGVLPTAFSGYYTTEFLSRFQALYEPVAKKLVERELLNSTAEELIAHHIIDTTTDMAGDGVYEIDSEDPAALTIMLKELDDLKELAFEDHDVLMLFDPRLDGIESSDDVQIAPLGLTNLHPKDWFEPFRSVQD